MESLPLPMDIINKIQLYVSTPEADMVRDNKLLHKRILMDLNTIRQMFEKKYIAINFRVKKYDSRYAPCKYIRHLYWLPRNTQPSPKIIVDCLKKSRESYDTCDSFCLETLRLYSGCSFFDCAMEYKYDGAMLSSWYSWSCDEMEISEEEFFQ